MLEAIFWACVATSLAVFGVIIWSVATFRRAGGHALVDRHAVTEVVWASIPIAILVLAAAPAIRLMSS
jgi:cytochrome c oxidase subunit II